jgi:hypothetical protein
MISLRIRIVRSDMPQLQTMFRDYHERCIARTQSLDVKLDALASTASTGGPAPAPPVSTPAAPGAPPVSTPAAPSAPPSAALAPPAGPCAAGAPPPAAPVDVQGLMNDLLLLSAYMPAPARAMARSLVLSTSNSVAPPPVGKRSRKDAAAAASAPKRGAVAGDEEGAAPVPVPTVGDVAPYAVHKEGQLEDFLTLPHDILLRVLSRLDERSLLAVRRLLLPSISLSLAIGLIVCSPHRPVAHAARCTPPRRTTSCGSAWWPAGSSRARPPPVLPHCRPLLPRVVPHSRPLPSPPLLLPLLLRFVGDPRSLEAGTGAGCLPGGLGPSRGVHSLRPLLLLLLLLVCCETGRDDIVFGGDRGLMAWQWRRRANSR